MSYTRVAHHARMMFDDTRNGAYARAVRAAIGSESVVIDLGAGLGVHGLLAAAAGATRVYLVEPQPVVRMAVAAAAAAGVTERIIIVQERIEDADLPEMADVIVSVFTGNLLFSEDLLPSLYHARDRYLRSEGRMVPDQAQLWLAPVAASSLHDRHVARWSRAVAGLDFSHAREVAASEILLLDRADSEGIVLLAPGVAALELDLMTSRTADCDATGACTVTTDGECHGLLVWTRIRLGAEWLSTDPSTDVHWSPAILSVDPPLPVRAGERLSLSLLRPAFGEWTWTIEGSNGVRRHSTFLARSEGPRELRRMAPDASPGLASDGARLLLVLERMRQGILNQAIADELVAAYGLAPALALREVQAIAVRYGNKR